MLARVTICEIKHLYEGAMQQANAPMLMRAYALINEYTSQRQGFGDGRPTKRFIEQGIMQRYACTNMADALFALACDAV